MSSDRLIREDEVRGRLGEGDIGELIASGQLPEPLGEDANGRAWRLSDINLCAERRAQRQKPDREPGSARPKLEVVK